MDDVVDGLAGLLPKSSANVCPPAPGLPTVAKYGLLDLEFAVPAQEAEGWHRPSVAQLRQLGLLRVHPATASNLGPVDDADVCLSRLFEEVESQALLLKVILDVADDSLPAQQRIKDFVARSSGALLPATFRVRDCCVTNAPSLWLERHFYL